jgi:hypothetical protein
LVFPLLLAPDHREDLDANFRFNQANDYFWRQVSRQNSRDGMETWHGSCEGNQRRCILYFDSGKIARAMKLAERLATPDAQPIIRGWHRQMNLFARF